MSIKTYQDKSSGNKLYAVYVNYRSKINPTLRIQKRKDGIETKAQALRVENQLLEECINQARQIESKGEKWGEICQLWFEYQERNTIDPIEKDTRDDYFGAVKKWTLEFWSLPYSEITKAHIRKTLANMEEEGKSKAHQKKVKIIFHRIFMWAIEEGLIKGFSTSPANGLKLKKTAEKQPEILTIDNIVKLLRSAKTLSSPWYPIWAMALLTGMRSGELYALEWNDINLIDKNIVCSKSFNNRHDVIKSTKAGYWRNIPINQDLEKLLLELKEKRTSNFVLPRIKDWERGLQAKNLRAFCITIGLPSVRFHSLRACFATQLIRNGVAPASVMKICGWKDLETMARYIRLAGIDEKGATASLQILPDMETLNKASELFKHA
jgi:integrase